MKTSREPRLPGLPRTEPEEDADTGVVELPWEEKDESENAGAFKEREQQADAVLTEPQISTTLRGAPDTVKLSAQTWKPPEGKGINKLPVQDTIKFTAQTWQPPAPNLTGPAEAEEEEDETTDVAAKPTQTPIVSEDEAEVAGVIRAEDGPARIVSHPPDGPMTPVPAPAAPPTIEVSPSAAHPRIDPGAEVTPVPRPAMPEATPLPARPAPLREGTPPPGYRERTPLPDYREATPLPRTAPPRRHPEPTTLVHAAPPRRMGMLIIVALLSAGLGLGAGYMLWGMNKSAASPASASVAGDSASDSGDVEPPADPETPAVQPTPQNCKLHIASEPDGATVKAGEVSLGQTPVDAELPCDAEVSMRISKRRFVSAVKTVSLSRDEVVKVSVELERPTYKVAIRSVPRGASVSINGKRQADKTPTTLELPGFEDAEIEVSKKGYKPYKTTFTPRRRRSILKPRLKRGR